MASIEEHKHSIEFRNYELGSLARTNYLRRPAKTG